MAIKVQRNKINFKGKMINIGIDMHKRFWHITALVEGDIVMTVTLARPNYDSLKKVLTQFEGNYVRIVYAACAGGFDLYDRLTTDGIECIVTPPSLIPTESGNRVKTNTKDSLKLAKLLESNMLKQVWVLTPEGAVFLYNPFLNKLLNLSTCIAKLCEYLSGASSKTNRYRADRPWCITKFDRYTQHCYGLPFIILHLADHIPG